MEFRGIKSQNTKIVCFLFISMHQAQCVSFMNFHKDFYYVACVA